MAIKTINPAVKKMKQARELIQAKEYVAARKILLTMDHPQAQKWLAKLDDLSPMETDALPQPVPWWLNPWLRFGLGVVAALFLGFVLGMSFGEQNAPGYFCQVDEDWLDIQGQIRSDYINSMNTSLGYAYVVEYIEYTPAPDACELEWSIWEYVSEGMIEVESGNREMGYLYIGEGLGMAYAYLLTTEEN